MPAFIECGFFILAFGGPTPYQHATDRSYGGILRRPEKYRSLVVHDDFFARPHAFSNENW